MNINLITTDIWQTLTAAARNSRRRSFVAVAYFGQGAARMLPLKRGSLLVVDASESAVKSGQTCPEELQKMTNRGVRIYTISNLHAKVFVIGNKAYIGSSNVSHRSSGILVEAVLATTDQATVSGAKQFVIELCKDELGPEAIARLAKLYRPPRITGIKPSSRHRTKQQGIAELPIVKLAQLVWRDPPEGSEDSEEAGRAVAARRRIRIKRHRLDDFHWIGKSSIQRGDRVIQVLDVGNNKRMIYPPARVLHTRKWSRGNKKVTFVYFEIPVRNRVSLKRMSKQLGRGSSKKLCRSGRVNSKLAEQLFNYWKIKL